MNYELRITNIQQGDGTVRQQATTFVPGAARTGFCQAASIEADCPLAASKNPNL
jgi:hypothetical protein